MTSQRLSFLLMWTTYPDDPPLHQPGVQLFLDEPIPIFSLGCLVAVLMTRT